MALNRIVCIGDSLTYGYGAYTEDAWPFIAGRRLGIQCINRGVNGETTAEMSLRFYEDVILNHPDAAVILGGSNDILMGASAESAFENIEPMVLKAGKSGICVMLGTPLEIDTSMVGQFWFCRKTPEQTQENIKILADKIRDFCTEEQLICIDFQKEYSQRMSERHMMRWYADGVHPVREGYHVMADIFCDAFVKMTKGDQR